MHHLLAGCSFTDPQWQQEIPWSVEYSKIYPSYIVAKAGMGIKGICTEALYHLKELDDIKRVIVMLPTLWRLDVEMDEETYLCNSMIDRLVSTHGTWKVDQHAVRKWITSGGLHYNSTTEQAKIFDLLYKHQGFLVILKEHLRALQLLINYCQQHSIEYYITAIRDPMEQLVGLDYFRENVVKLLDEVEFDRWIRFDNKFVDKFFNHQVDRRGQQPHPTTQEHTILCKYILAYIDKKGNQQ